MSRFYALVGAPQTGKSDLFERLRSRYGDSSRFCFVKEAAENASFVEEVYRLSRECKRTETPPAAQLAMQSAQLALQWVRLSVLIKEVIRPALQAKKTVVINGFGGSAYVHAAACCNEREKEHLLNLHKVFIESCVLEEGVPPPEYLWLRASPEYSLERLRRAGRNEFTLHDIEKLNKEFQFYGTLPQQSVRQVRVDGDASSNFAELCGIIEGENVYA